MFIKVRPPMFSPKTLVHFPVMYMPITALPHFPTASLLKGPLVLLWKGPEAPPQGFLVSVLVLASCHYLCGQLVEIVRNLALEEITEPNCLYHDCQVYSYSAEKSKWKSKVMKSIKGQRWSQSSFSKLATSCTLSKGSAAEFYDIPGLQREMPF